MNDVLLVSDGLLSKWGFEDGDLLDWLADYGFDHDQRHATLRALVRRHLLPALNQSVEVEEICTIHNPIRAVTVDQRPVTEDWLSLDATVALTPPWVTISGAVVLALARDVVGGGCGDAVKAGTEADVSRSS